MSDPSANQPPRHTDHPSRHSDFSATGAEERVGKLIAEIGVVIRSADPDCRVERKELTEQEDFADYEGLSPQRPGPAAGRLYRCGTKTRLRPSAAAYFIRFEHRLFVVTREG